MLTKISFMWTYYLDVEIYKPVSGCPGEHVAHGPFVSNVFIQYMVLVLLFNINAFIRKQWSVTLSTGMYKHVPFEDQDHFYDL